MAEQSLTFRQYLDGLPAERRGEVERVWRVVRGSVPRGYVERIGPKYLSFMAGDDWYVALANQKNYISLHLLPVYVVPELRAKLEAGGKKLKMGKGCVNFKRADELPLDVLAEIVAATKPEDYKALCARARGRNK